MEIELMNTIIAIVTHNPEKVQTGFAPVFFSQDDADSERLALLLAKITDGMVHNLENGVFVIVKH